MFLSQSKGSTGKGSEGSVLSDPGNSGQPKSSTRADARYGATQSPPPGTTGRPATTSIFPRFWRSTPPPTLGNSFTSQLPQAEQLPPPSPNSSMKNASGSANYRSPKSPPVMRAAPVQPKASRAAAQAAALQARAGTSPRTISQFPTSTTAQAMTPREKDYRRAPFVCEFLGTAMFAFTVCCLKFTGDDTYNAAAIGSAFMVLIYAVGPTSGGNLNPAVSFTLALLGKLRWPVAAGYMLVQTLGALLGATIAKLVLFSHATPRFLVAPEEPYRLREAAEMEALFTAMLCFVVANCVASEKNNPAKDQNQFYGLAIGASVIAGGYATSNISGGCLNPALALSLNSPDIKEGIRLGFEYAGFEMLGACLAAGLYCMCRPSFEDEDIDRRQFGDEVSSHSLGPRIASEFIGTFFLVVTVGFCLVMKCPATPVAAAAALMSMVYSIGTVSGGHFNPAVTLAVVLGGRGKCAMTEGCLYALVQVMAGVSAGVFVAFVHGFVNHLTISSVLSPKQDFTWSESFAAEIVFTTLLAYVVLAVTTSPPRTSLTTQHMYFGLAVGACYIVGGFAIGVISGGVLNPAVATGVASQSSLIVSFGKLWWKPKFAAVHTAHVLGTEALRTGFFSQISNLFQFTMAELMGGALAAGVFGLTHPQEFDKMGMPKYSSRGNFGLREDDPSLTLL